MFLAIKISAHVPMGLIQSYCFWYLGRVQKVTEQLSLHVLFWLFSDCETTIKVTNKNDHNKNSFC